MGIPSVRGLARVRFGAYSAAHVAHDGVHARARARAARAHLATALTLGFAFAATVTGARAGFDAAAGRGASITVFVLWTAGAWFSVCTRARAGVNPRASPAVWAFTFAVGILWMHACADELVGVFQAAGPHRRRARVPAGATVMAWGASANDLGGMLAMARAGYVKMAVTRRARRSSVPTRDGSGLSMVIVRLRGVAIDSELAPSTVFLLWFGAAFVLAYYGFVVPLRPAGARSGARARGPSPARTPRRAPSSSSGESPAGED